MTEASNGLPNRAATASKCFDLFRKHIRFAVLPVQVLIVFLVIDEGLAVRVEDQFSVIGRFSTLLFHQGGAPVEKTLIDITRGATRTFGIRVKARI